MALSAVLHCLIRNRPLWGTLFLSYSCESSEDWGRLSQMNQIEYISLEKCKNAIKEVI